MEKIGVLELAGQMLLEGNINGAKGIVQNEYPFHKLEANGRAYTDKQKMKQFKRDGFIYHPHWKMEECHNAYWEFVPTVDHIYPVALGGLDSEENWATTSMLHNSIKSNWTLEQLHWKLFDAGHYEEWDGLTSMFVELVKADKSLLQDPYIKKWYKLSEI